MPALNVKLVIVDALSAVAEAVMQVIVDDDKLMVRIPAPLMTRVVPVIA